MNPQVTQANVEFTNGEANALLQLIDIAIKSGGLNVAEAGFVIAKKVNAAFEPPKEKDVLQQLPE